MHCAKRIRAIILSAADKRYNRQFWSASHFKRSQKFSQLRYTNIVLSVPLEMKMTFFLLSDGCFSLLSFHFVVSLCLQPIVPFLKLWRFSLHSRQSFLNSSEKLRRKQINPILDKRRSNRVYAYVMKISALRRTTSALRETLSSSCFIIIKSNNGRAETLCSISHSRWSGRDFINFSCGMERCCE